MQEAQHGRGQNSVHSRRFHERLLLQKLRRAGEASKADLARISKLTSTAVGSIVVALEKAGLVEYGGRKTGGRGQPATLIRLNPKGAFGVGVRLDRDSIETAVVDFAGEILDRRVHIGALPSPAETLSLVHRDITAVLKALSDDERKRLAGVGVAQPYHLGSWLDRLVLGVEFRAWDEIDFAYELGQATGLPVYSQNDGNAAAIAELFYGRGREFDDFIYIFFGPVIGCGVAIAGDCLLGISGNAGDIAVMPVPPSRLASAPPPEGKWDLLLSRASLNVLARHLRSAGETIATHADLAAFVVAGHPAVMEWADDCIDALTPALQSALCMLDVPCVIIDADVDAGLIDLLMHKLEKSLAETTSSTRAAPELIRGSFGSDAGALGAASLPLFFNFSPR